MAAKDKKVVILSGRGGDTRLFNRTPELLANRDHVNGLADSGVNGVAINIPASWSLMDGKPLDERQTYDHWLAPLEKAFPRLDSNYLRVNINDPGDVFDDAAWKVTADNFGKLAGMAQRAGLAGFMFDNEEYFRPWLNYPENYSAKQVQKRSPEAYERKTRDRGGELMAAMVAKFPQVRVMFLHGPYKSDPATPRSVRANQFSDATEYELAAPLYFGFLDTAGDQATVMDGGEFYQYRKPEDFSASAAWRNEGMVDASGFVPKELRASWAKRSNVSFGVFNQAWPDAKRNAMTPDIFKTTMRNALQAADDTVWIWTEKTNLLNPEADVQPWLDAVRQARSD